MVFEKPHRLPQKGTADSLALDQFGFAPDQVPRLQSVRHDDPGDVARHGLGALAGARRRSGRRTREGVDGSNGGGRSLGLSLEVRAHTGAGQLRVTGNDSLRDLRVGLPRLPRPWCRPGAAPPASRALPTSTQDVDEELETGVAADGGDERVGSRGPAPRVGGPVVGEVAQLGADRAPRSVRRRGRRRSPRGRCVPRRSRRGRASTRCRYSTTASVTAPTVGSVMTSPPPGPRRVQATCWCSTSRTASRNTARLTR